MSDYLETDFCDADSGLDYIFGYMGAIYGASFNRHWEGMDAGLIRQVWKEQLGRFLTYKPSLDYAIKHLNADFPPSAIKFREYCNAGPYIASKPVVQITRQKTQAEIEESERKKVEALAKLEELKKSYKGYL
jgi:hypothetical protein